MCDGQGGSGAQQKVIALSSQASLGIMQHYEQLWRMHLQSYSSSNKRLLEHLSFLKSSKRKCQWLETILQHGSVYSIWEAFSPLYCKGRLWFFPEPHVVKGNSINTGGWRDICLLCNLGEILSKSQSRFHRTWPLVMRNPTWNRACRYSFERSAWYQSAWE